MEDEMTQTEWSYSDESLAAREDAVEVLSRDTKVYPEAREKEGPVEAEEEAAAEDGEENNQAGLCEKEANWQLFLAKKPCSSLSSLPKRVQGQSQMRSHCPWEESMRMMGRQLPSAQASYPSGHVAILIMFSKEALFTYCVLEDSRYPGIRAAFRNHGHGVCIHPDGQLWATLDPCTGICLDQTGACQKRWKWHDFSHHVHSPPFQSITMKLNNYITIKILAQDQIDLLFTSSSDSIRFNVRSRLKVSTCCVILTDKPQDTE
ncbi:glutamate-rich protein 6B [Grus japonensis]|uniref:Glutamate-rich protein 6B n=1 Tax=Grus japonensis TaxID=30415 RepID=A0ABC9W3J5_GRUJA